MKKTTISGDFALSEVPALSPADIAPAEITTAAGRAQPRRRHRRRWADRLAPYLFISPFLVSFLVFFVLPSAFSLALSFARYNGYTEVHWVGLQNYRSLLQAPDFRQAVSNTIFYWLVPLVPMLGGALALALLVRSKMARWPRAYRPLIFVPQVMAPVAAALVWRVMLSNHGVLNSVLHLHTSWLADPRAMKWGVVLLLVWRGLGWYFVVFLAGLSAIPDDLLEAARVDGSTALQSLRHITLPLLRPTLLFAVVIDTIASLQLFTEPNLLVGGSGSLVGAPPSAAPVMNQVVTNVAGGQFGLASAVGWLIFVAIGVFSLIQFRIFREARS
jgi:ABC-type sugar transport system permease subunit